MDFPPDPTVGAPVLDPTSQPGFVLVNENFEFPDLLGAAYEFLIKFFADSAGKKGGEFYTPGEVVRLLVQLTQPEAGNDKQSIRAGPASSELPVVVGVAGARSDRLD